jgi:hypothetical protein
MSGFAAGCVWNRPVPAAAWDRPVPAAAWELGL